MHKPEAFWHETYHFCYKNNKAIKGPILTRKVRVSNQNWRHIIKTQMITTITWIQDKSQLPKKSSLFIYLFTYDLFNNTVKHSAYIEPNDRKGNEWYIGKYVQRKGMA